MFTTYNSIENRIFHSVLPWFSQGAITQDPCEEGSEMGQRPAWQSWIIHIEEGWGMRIFIDANESQFFHWNGKHKKREAELNSAMLDWNWFSIHMHTYKRFLDLPTERAWEQWNPRKNGHILIPWSWLLNTTLH